MSRVVFTVWTDVGSNALTFEQQRFWFLERNDHELRSKRTVFLFDTRSQAIGIGRAMALLVAEFGGSSQLRVKGMDGKFKFERTYPRKSDPRRRKG